MVGVLHRNESRWIRCPIRRVFHRAELAIDRREPELSELGGEHRIAPTDIDPADVAHEGLRLSHQHMMGPGTPNGPDPPGHSQDIEGHFSLACRLPATMGQGSLT